MDLKRINAEHIYINVFHFLEMFPWLLGSPRLASYQLIAGKFTVYITLVFNWLQFFFLIKWLFNWLSKQTY